jgi:mannose-6-phosphate isomerase-like protein (cupin superfamily)
MKHSEREQQENERGAPNANRTVHLLGPDFRITELELAQDAALGWHRHTSVDDTFYVVEGRVRVALREPDEEIVLERGQSWGAVRHGRPHDVSNAGQSRAVVLVMQGFGEYDFLPVD